MSQGHPTQRKPSLRYSRGVGLVEVLIAVLILGIGMLGIAAMQATALRNGQGSMQRTQAVASSYAILDAMRANPTVSRAAGYNFAMATPCVVPAVGTSLKDNDLNWWITSLRATLGNTACGSIACVDATDTCTIRVTWTTSQLANSGDPNLLPFVQTVGRL